MAFIWLNKIDTIWYAFDNNFDSKDDTRKNFFSAIEYIIDLMIVSEEQNSTKKNGELNQVNTGYFIDWIY
jgi:hypothetical protein